MGSKMSEVILHLLSHVIISYHCYFYELCKMISILNLKGKNQHVWLRAICLWNHWST